MASSRKNPGASLVDLGDGIACIEFHSKMNTLGQDIVTFMQRTLRPGSDAVKNFKGFVVTSDAAKLFRGREFDAGTAGDSRRGMG